MLGERLRQLRVERNLTQAEMAAAADISIQSMRRLETGESGTIATLLRVLKALEAGHLLDPLLHTPLVSPMMMLQRGRSTPKRARRSRRTRED